MNLIKELKETLEKSARQKPSTPMRRFYFERKEDETGISGTGYVAEGIEFSDGSCVAKWLTETSSVTFFKSAEDMMKIHGHQGRTQVVYEDAEVKKAQILKLAEDLQKSLASSPLSGIDINTAEYSQDALMAQNNPWRERLRTFLADFKLGDAPRELLLDEDKILVASQVDNGIYDGYVKEGNQSSGDFGQILFRVVKMTLDSMVQALMAKEFISMPPVEVPVPAEPQPPVPTPDSQLGMLVDALRQHSIQGDVNITINKSAPDRIYISFDGDNIGNQVALAEEKDNEEALKEVESKIKAGQELFEKWVSERNGEIIQSGGDEGLGRLNLAPSKEEIEDFRKQYKEVTGGFTVTVGTGGKISEATKARMLGKLLGKDRVQVYDQDTKAQLKQKLDEDEPSKEAKKLNEAGFGKSVANLVDVLKKFVQ